MKAILLTILAATAISPSFAQRLREDRPEFKRTSAETFWVNHGNGTLINVFALGTPQTKTLGLELYLKTIVTIEAGHLLRLTTVDDSVITVKCRQGVSSTRGTRRWRAVPTYELTPDQFEYLRKTDVKAFAIQTLDETIEKDVKKRDYFNLRRCLGLLRF